jgi:hypothetical protein
MFKIRCTVIVLALLLSFSLAANADTITLTDIYGPNTVVNIDPDSQAGVYEWIVDGTNHIFQNSYWYSIGNGPITPVTSLGSPTVTPFAEFMAQVLYAGDLFDFQVDYILAGWDIGTGQSDIAQTVTVTNKTGSPLNFTLYEYLNLDLNGNKDGQTGTMTSSGAFSQTEGITLSEITINAVGSTSEVGDAATLLAKLYSNDPIVANNSYVGDVGVVFAMNFQLHQSWMMSQDNRVINGAVPEPSGIMALVGMVGLLPLMRRRRA